MKGTERLGKEKKGGKKVMSFPSLDIQWLIYLKREGVERVGGSWRWNLRWIYLGIGREFEYLESSTGSVKTRTE